MSINPIDLDNKTIDLMNGPDSSRRFPRLPPALSSALLISAVLLLFELLKLIGWTVPNASLILLGLVIYAGVSSGMLAAFATVAIALGYTSFELSEPGRWLQFSEMNAGRMITSVMVGIGIAIMVGWLHQRAERRVDRAAAAAAIDARDEFIAIAAHDLKTPLTGLLLRAQMTSRRLLADRAELPEAIEALQEVERHGQRMTNMIDRLLDVSRIDTGGLDMEFEDVDVTALLQQVLESSMTTHLGRIKISAPEICPARVDPLRIGQIVSNLVENALRYNGEGDPVEVNLSLDEGGDNFVIQVRDHGPGVPRDLAAYIFDRNSQGKHGRRGKLGLGLYITRHIVLAHGGSINLQNMPDGGASFVTTLPIESSKVYVRKA